MKSAIHLLCCLFLFFVQVFFLSENGYAGTDERGYKNYYGIAWCGKPMEDMKYARQMCYDYTAINPSCNPREYHKNPDCAGLKFYLTDPYFYSQVLSGYSKTIDTTRPIADEAKDFYNQRMVWKSNDSFPDNLATGYYPDGVSTKISIMWDFQQQAVIDEVVEKIIQVAKSYENQDLSFTFGGYIIDAPGLAGEFYRLDEHGKNISVGLSDWTGVDSGLVHDTITHEYATYAEGRAAFYKQLFHRTREECPGIKVVMEPHDIYNNWVKEVKDRADKNELMPDALFQESAGTAFVDDKEIFDSGLVRKDDVGSIQTNEQGESENRLYAAKAAINGAWYNWSGGPEGRQDLQSITGVYPRLKLIRCLPNWDNLNHVPLTDRTWDGNIYQSTKSYLSSDIMYSRHPKTGKLFAVFLTLSGAVTLNTGESVSSVQRTDGFFVETQDGITDVTITGNEICLKSKENIGKGYIFTLSSDGGSSMVSTGPETDETSSSEALNGTGNGSGLSSTTWVEYVSSRGRDGKGIGTKSIISQQSVTTQTWQQVRKRTKAQKTAGLSGGEGWQMIFDMAYAPSNPNIVYLTTDTNQVWKSTDGGTSWQKKSSGFNANGGLSVVVDPANANIVYVAGSVMGTWADLPLAGEGIYRTVNGGDSWTKVYSAHFHRQVSGKVIAFAGSTIYAGPYSGGLLKSNNGGTTWNLVQKAGGGYVLNTLTFFCIAAHPNDNTILFASTSDGKFYKITDSGGSATVTQIGTGLPGCVAEFVINSSSPNIIYAATRNYGVYKSTNGGLNFSAINNGLSNPLNSGGAAVRIAVSSADSNRLFVTFNGLWGNHLYYTTNGGSSWTQPASMDEQNADGWVCGSTLGIAGSLGIDNSSAPIAFHPTNGNIALTIGYGNQVKKTTDGGLNWRYSNTGYTGSMITIPGRSQAISWDPNNSNRAIFFHGDFGPMITQDNEDTFTKLRLPLFDGREENSCGAMNGNTIVALSGKETLQRITVSWNAGQSWTQFAFEADFSFVAFHPQNSNIIYADNYKSTDNGRTWRTLPRIVLGMYRGNGNIVYSFSDSTVSKSIDGGSTWTTPYPSLNIPAGYCVSQIAIDPNNENRIYAVVREKGVYIITNTASAGGTVLLRNDAHGLTKDSFNKIGIYSITTDTSDSNVVYVGTYMAAVGHSNGIFRSTDAGMTWTNITGNLGPELNIASISINPHNRYVYIGSFAGTWKLPPPSTTAIADTTAPNCSISINGGASSTNSTAVTLALSATDNVGVTGYYLSTSTSTPLASAAGWTTVSSTTSYTGNASYTLSNGDGIKTVNVWYKDAAGNISIVASDSITLDTTNVSGTTGLQALYKFDEGSGTIANDASGSGNNGTISGATWATGKSGSGLSFDGNDYVNKATPSAVLKPSLEVATAAWIKMSGTDTGGAEIVSMGDSYAIRVQTNGNIQFFYYNGTTWKSIITTGVNVRDGAWHHIVGQKTSAALQIYVDGVSKASTLNTGTIAYTQGTGLFIGKHGNGDTIYDFTGSIDDVRIYNRALSNQEVLDLYNAFAAKDTTSPQSSININNGTPYTKSSAVTLTLSATDDVGVTGYYLSASSSTPLASTTGWTAVTSTTSYTGSISYTLSSGDGDKAVYVWYKDAAGNVSAGVSDSITLDATAPMITITSPTSSSTHSTTNSTVSLGGNVSDSTSGAAVVTWSNSKGGSGTASGTTNWSISNISLSLGDNAITVTATDGANNTGTDIITITYDVTPRVTTGSATNMTSSSATLHGTVNANGLSTTAWFEYDTSSGSFGSKTSPQSVSGASDTAVGSVVSGFSPGNMCYYRIVAQNNAGTTYGNEMSFTAVDTSAPNCLISINNGALYTNSSIVSLTLSATDDVGVTGYYLSASSSVPLASATGWTLVTSTTSYTGSVSYTVNSGDGDKTVYAWYKDAAGNVSTAVSDSITLDATAPMITITSPTSSSTHTTTSNTISLGGSAADSMSGAGVVTWCNSKGGSGTASGTNSWSISNVNLSGGNNVIVVTVTDGAGNTGTATIIVTVPETNTTTGIQSLYKFDEGSGTIANDSSGNGNNGTMSGATWATGKSESGLSFDGNDYVVTTTPSAVLKPSLEVATAAWIKTSAGGGEILSMGDSYALRVQTNGNIQFFYYNGTTWKSIMTTGVNVLDGAWHHIVGQKTSTALQIYVDGISKASTPNTGTISYTQGTGFFIGRHGNGNTFYGFKGLIDEARVYNRTLTDQEVLDLYNGI